MQTSRGRTMSLVLLLGTLLVPGKEVSDEGGRGREREGMGEKEREREGEREGEREREMEKRDVSSESVIVINRFDWPLHWNSYVRIEG